MPLSLFSVEVRAFEHISFSADDAALLQTVIWAIYIGIVLAALLSLYQQCVPSRLIRALLTREAFDKERACTLATLGLDKNPLIALELRFGSALKKLVKSTADGAGESATPPNGENGEFVPENGAMDAAEDAPDPQSAVPVRYYIPEDLKYRAEVRYGKKGNGVVAFFLTVLLSLAVVALLMKLIPPILGMIDAIL